LLRRGSASCLAWAGVGLVGLAGHGHSRFGFGDGQGPLGAGGVEFGELEVQKAEVLFDAGVAGIDAEDAFERDA